MARYSIQEAPPSGGMLSSLPKPSLAEVTYIGGNDNGDPQFLQVKMSEDYEHGSSHHHPIPQLSRANPDEHTHMDMHTTSSGGQFSGPQSPPFPEPR